MKIEITIDTDNAAFEDDPGELRRILDTVTAKVTSQLAREPGCVCDAPEIDDKLLDINGNTVGRVRVTEDATDALERELAELEAAFEAAGGRGIEMAERIDEIRQALGE